MNVDRYRCEAMFKKKKSRLSCKYIYSPEEKQTLNEVFKMLQKSLLSKIRKKSEGGMIVIPAVKDKL